MGVSLAKVLALSLIKAAARYTDPRLPYTHSAGAAAECVGHFTTRRTCTAFLVMLAVYLHAGSSYL